MATVNFSIPEDVKELFNQAFAGKNRSAVVAELMRDAARHELSMQQRRDAVAGLLQDREGIKPVKPEKIRAALREVRQ